MKHQLKFKHAVPWVLLLSMALVPSVFAQTSVEVTYTWTPPSSGTPVDHYIVELSVNGSPFYQIDTSTSNTITITVPVDETHQVRVAGVDASDRQGPYSESSDPYTPDVGPPGQPGKPRPLF
jgi:hypothetical protein